MNPIGSFNDNVSDGHSTSGTFVSVGTLVPLCWGYGGLGGIALNSVHPHCSQLIEHGICPSQKI